MLSCDTLRLLVFCRDVDPVHIGWGGCFIDAARDLRADQASVRSHRYAVRRGIRMVSCL